MYFQIKNVILWPRKAQLAPRVISFELGKVNVITGASRTGKSAVIPIIDYCLGSDKCAIPVNTIRDACAWFGVIVQTSDRQILLARKTPEKHQKTTGDMYVIEAQEVAIPFTIEDKNDSADGVKRALDELAGLSRMETNPDASLSGFTARLSFRDLAAFNFQPQNIVANPDVFFYKADTYEHREKLKAIFPYVLGAVTPEVLIKQFELSQLEKDLQRKGTELKNVQSASQEWVSEVEAHLSQARELGLLAPGRVDDGRWETRIELLRAVVERIDRHYEITEAAIVVAAKELAEFEKEEGELALEASGYRSRLVKMEQLRDAANMYSQSLFVQRDRLKVSEWIRSIAMDGHECPMCGTDVQDAEPLGVLDTLVQSLEAVERATLDFKVVPAAIDREHAQIRTKLRVTLDRLKGIHIKQQQLEITSEQAQRRRYDLASVSRFIGNLERALHLYNRLETDRDLQGTLKELQERITALRVEINPEGIRERTRQALRQISVNAGRIVPNLDAERPNAPMTLSVKDLNVTVASAEGEDYLWEIGSGSNWLSYHLAVSLGWQQFFTSTETSPVPSFLVYDQPSQVYFPKRLTENDNDPGYLDADVEAVRKIFRTLSHVVGQTQGKLQVIVLDHAPKSIWGNEEHVIEIEEWRSTEKLVPLSWIDERA